MSNKRIRYKKNELGEMVSNAVFRTSEGDVKVHLYGEGFTSFKLVKATDGSIVHTDSSGSSVTIKRKVKEALANMGVEFAPETRTSTSDLKAVREAGVNLD